MYYIKLSNEILNNEEITDEELATYICLYPILNTAIYEDTVGISIEILHENMYGCSDVNRNRSKILSKCVKSLLNKKVITGESRTATSFRLNKIADCDTKYTFVSYEYVTKILRSEYKNKAELIRYLCVVLASRKYKTKIGVQPIKYFVNSLSLNEKTIIRYNETLEDMKILYIRREQSNNGKNNCYGSYEDKQAIDDYADSNNYGKDTSVTSNWLRSVCQKYNYYIKHPEKEMTIEDKTKFNSYNNYCKERAVSDPLWQYKVLDLTKLKENVIM